MAPLISLKTSPLTNRIGSEYAHGDGGPLRLRVRSLLERVTSGKRLRLALSLALVSVVGLPASSAATQPQRLPPCTIKDFAPDLRASSKAFCAHVVESSETGSTIGLAFYVSRDAGYSFERASATGLVVTRADDVIDNLIISPLYESDHTVYVQTRSGLFATTDDGDTFTLVDRLATGGLAPFVAAPSLLNPQPHTAFAMVKGEFPALVDPPLHIPVAASPDEDRRFLIPPDFAESGEAYVIASHNDSPGKWHASIYRCNAVLTCTEKLHSFPQDWSFQGYGAGHEAWMAPDFRQSRRMYIYLENFKTNQYKAWISRDSGESFKPWASVNKLFWRTNRFKKLYGNKVRISVFLRLASHSRFPKTIFIYVWQSYESLTNYGEKPLKLRVPRSGVFRSKNHGDTWRWMGALPGNSNYGYPLSLESDGRLTMLAAKRGKPALNEEGKVYFPGYYGLFCSMNEGRSWTRGCPRQSTS